MLLKCLHQIQVCVRALQLVLDLVKTVFELKVLMGLSKDDLC